VSTTQRDEGGIFGVVGHRDGVALAYTALEVLGAHGRWARGMAVVDDDNIRTRSHRNTNAFRLDRWVESLSVGGKNVLAVAIGHPQLTEKAGSVPQEPVAPFCATIDDANIAVSMVGGFANGAALREELMKSGALFSTQLHAELLLHLVSRSRKKSLLNRLVDALWQVDGGYAVVLIFKNKMIAVRDPAGLRPLFVGEIDNAYSFSSSSGALVSLRAENVRMVAAGDLLVVESGQINRVRPFLEKPALGCPMELLEIEGLNGIAYGRSVYKQRMSMMEALAEAFEPSIDLVLALSDREAMMAVTFASAIGAPYIPALQGRHHRKGEDGRTFEALVAPVGGMRVALIVSGLFTGESVTVAIAALHEAGATDVHVVCTSPPRRERCEFGIAGPDRNLIGEKDPSMARVRDTIGAKSVLWLSPKTLSALLGGGNWCWHCVTGDPPMVNTGQDQLGLFSEE
jgi:amidophosphoribosyltransferase